MDEKRVPDRFYHVHERVLHDPVRVEWQDIDGALFWFIDGFLFVWRRGECFVDEAILNVEQVVIKVHVEILDGILPGFAFPSCVIRLVYVVDIGYPSPKVSVSSHVFIGLGSFRLCLLTPTCPPSCILLRG